VEFSDDLAYLDQSWYASLDGGDSDRLCLRERISSNRHETSDRSGRWDPAKILDIGLLRPPFAGRPFADNAQRASEAARLQAAPKFSAVSATGGPLIVEPWQVLIEGALPGPEDIMAFASDHLSHQLPAMAGLAYDLLDRCSAFRQGQDSFRQGQDSRIGLFAAKVSFVLQAFGRGKKFGIDGCRPDCTADLADPVVSASREKAVAPVFHTMIECEFGPWKQAHSEGRLRL
jgi:hypothetical protein